MRALFVDDMRGWGNGAKLLTGLAISVFSFRLKPFGMLGWMFSMLPRLPPKLSLLMYLSRSSLARLVRVDALDKRNEPLMIRSTEFQPPRWFGRVRTPVGGEGGMSIVFLSWSCDDWLRLPGAVLLSKSSPFIAGLLKLSLLLKLSELLALDGRGGRPDKSLVAVSCWKVRVKVFLGVVGGAGVRLLSLPFSDETLFDELAPPWFSIFFYFNFKFKELFLFSSDSLTWRFLRSKLRKQISIIELQKKRFLFVT